MNSSFIHHQQEPWTVVQFTNPSMMDPTELERVAQDLYRLIEAEDRRKIIMDFEKVQYMSSQALGIVMAMRKKLGALKNSKLILCSVCPPLQQLLKITGLDKLLIIKPTQHEALKVVA